MGAFGYQAIMGDHGDNPNLRPKLVSPFQFNCTPPNQRVNNTSRPRAAEGTVAVVPGKFHHSTFP
jgi:hypothetical protein